MARATTSGQVWPVRHHVVARARTARTAPALVWAARFTRAGEGPLQLLRLPGQPLALRVCEVPSATTEHELLAIVRALDEEGLLEGLEGPTWLDLVGRGMAAGVLAWEAIG